MTSLSGVKVTLDGTYTPVVSPWVSLINSTLVITSGAITLPNLADFSGSSLQLSGGASLSLPVLSQGNITLGNGTRVTIQGTLVIMPADRLSATPSIYRRCLE